MAELVNLRTARKRAMRRQQEGEAATNRLVHGQPKPVREVERQRREKARRDLDWHRIETGEKK